MLDDEKTGATPQPAFEDGAELSDEALENVAGGLIYHDEGDPSAHRKEAFYVLDDSGDIIMKLASAADAKHWAGNLRTSQRMISATEFAKLRKG